MNAVGLAVVNTGPAFLQLLKMSQHECTRSRRLRHALCPCRYEIATRAPRGRYTCDLTRRAVKPRGGPPDFGVSGQPRCDRGRDGGSKPHERQVYRMFKSCRADEG